MKPPSTVLITVAAFLAFTPDSRAIDEGDSTVPAIVSDSMVPAVTGDSTVPVVVKDSTGPAIVKDSTVSVVAIKNTPEPPADLETLGGNLSRSVAAKKQPYLVTSDIYVPSGKTVTLEPGVVLLFKNFTGMHVEGRLIAAGTAEKPIVFSSEYDRTYNPAARLNANPYDWNGIYIHEGGIGSVLANCKILFSVYGITALTKYIKFDNVRFLSNGRSDLTIEGKKPQITGEPYSYTLTVNYAKRDGVPVEILMDPFAKKRKILRYSGLSLLASGGTMGLLWGIQVGRDNKRLDDIRSDLVVHSSDEFDVALREKKFDVGVTVTSLIVAVIGAAGLGFSFTF